MLFFKPNSTGVKLVPKTGRRALHRLMVEAAFPDVPSTFKEAEPFFRETLPFGFYVSGRLKAAFLFGEITEESAFLDVVCAPEYKGRWATAKLLSVLYKSAFEMLGLKFIWVQPKNQESLKAALKAGFVYAGPFRKREPVLILTPRQLPSRFYKKLNLK